MTDAEKALRAQILATEHWSLLASRSTTQSEVLSRISMFLTLVSAGLVSLALMGQATKFADPFPVFAIAVLAIVNLVGILTQIRVYNVALEDLMYVLAMNRLRGSYAQLDPGVVPSLMASRFDDARGMGQTYYFLEPKRGASHIAGSSMIFITAVNSALLGLLCAVIANLIGAGLVVAAVIGAVLMVAFFVFWAVRGQREFMEVWRHHEPLHPTPDD